MYPGERLVADRAPRGNVDDPPDELWAGQAQGQADVRAFIAKRGDPDAVRAARIVRLPHELPVTLDDLVGPNGDGISRAAARHDVEDHLLVVAGGKVLPIDARRSSTPGADEHRALSRGRAREGRQGPEYANRDAS